MRQPGRSFYKDFDRSTFSDFLDTLLDLDNFNVYKEVEGQPLVAPRWSFCLSYELEIRKEAIRLCKEESYGIQSALWTTLKNTEHSMKHWLKLVAISNAPSSSKFSGDADIEEENFGSGESSVPISTEETDFFVERPRDACPSCLFRACSRSERWQRKKKQQEKEQG